MVGRSGGDSMVDEVEFVNTNVSRPQIVVCRRLGYPGFDNSGGGRWYRAIRIKVV